MRTASSCEGLEGRDAFGAIPSGGLGGAKEEAGAGVEPDLDDEDDALEKLRDRCFPVVETPELNNRFSLLDLDWAEWGPGAGLTFVSMARRELYMGSISPVQD